MVMGCSGPLMEMMGLTVAVEVEEMVAKVTW